MTQCTKNPVYGVLFANGSFEDFWQIKFIIKNTDFENKFFSADFLNNALNSKICSQFTGKMFYCLFNDYRALKSFIYVIRQAQLKLLELNEFPALDYNEKLKCISVERLNSVCIGVLYSDFFISMPNFDILQNLDEKELLTEVCLSLSCLFDFITKNVSFFPICLNLNICKLF